MSYLELNNIYKKYDKNSDYSVRDFNLHVEEGEFIAFVGPSGCGKTTTLRMVAGLEEISEGELRLNDELINEKDPKDRDMAMVFQSYALYPHMSVEENISFGLKLRKIPRYEIEKRVTDAAYQLGLTEVLKKRPKNISGGQRQRVALARSIVREPKVFLMDEPLSNLDAKLRASTRIEIKKLHKRLNATTIYVTHDQIEAMTMADRIVILNRGEIQQVGEPLELYNRPVNKFVASFIGSPQMNFLRVKVEDGQIKIKNKYYTLPKKMYDRLENQGYNGRVVTFGIRPEDLISDNRLVDVVAESENIVELELDVNLTENIGSELYIYSEIDEQDFLAKLSSRHTKVEDKMTIYLDFNRAHFFDENTGARIEL